MIRLSQHDSPVRPVKPVIACRESDLSFASPAIHHLKKHVPAPTGMNHKRVGDEAGLNVRDVPAREDGVIDSREGAKAEWGLALINSDRPHSVSTTESVNRSTVAAPDSGNERL